MVSMSDARWAADARFVTRTHRQHISKADRDATRDKLMKLVPGGVGKRKRYRYLSDFAFKSESDAIAFWNEKIEKAGLSEVAEISPHYYMAF